MLPVGTQVLAAYRGFIEDGSIVDEVGTIDHPRRIVIGDFGMPKNVSVALATMQPGETRIVKAPFLRKGQKPISASYEINFFKVLNLDAVSEEVLHGAECACGCHKLREAFAN